MKTDIHPKYVDAEIRCACGNVIKTRSTKPVIIVGICNVCHPFYTGQQKFVDTAGRVDKFQQRLAKTQAAQAEAATRRKRSSFCRTRPHSAVRRMRAVSFCEWRRISIYVADRPARFKSNRKMDLRPHIEKFRSRFAEVEAALSDPQGF